MSGKLVLVVLAVGSLLLGGCAPLVFTAGAGTGYVATQDKPRNKIEAFFDDLARSIRQTTRKITGAPPSRRKSTAKPTSTLQLAIQKATLSPAKVRTGDQITLTLRYSIAGAPKKGIQVREKSSLSKDGKTLSLLKDESSQRENGVWENTLSFAVPQSAKPGSYTVTMRISAQGLNRNVRKTFTVQ